MYTHTHTLPNGEGLEKWLVHGMSILRAIRPINFGHHNINNSWYFVELIEPRNDRANTVITFQLHKPIMLMLTRPSSLRSGNETTLAWGLGTRLHWHGVWERDYTGMGSGNETTLAWGLGTRLHWHGVWERDYTGMGSGNETTLAWGLGMRLHWHGIILSHTMTW